MWNEDHPRWLLFAGEVVISAQEIKAKDEQMAVQVKGLAETVRQAKAAIDKASTVSQRVNNSAQQLVQTMTDVEAMTTQLDSANAELQAALGQVTNGAPPLETGAGAQTSSSAAPAPDPAGTPAHDVLAAKKQVEQQNASVQATADKYIPSAATVAA